MSTFDDASLVFIPSGYKTSKAYSVKPSDGSGDLTFSRSNDTATRVASNGLIEKVRTQQYFKSTAMITSSLYTIYGVTPTSLGTYPVYSDSLAYQWLNAGNNQGASFTIGSDSAPRVFSFFAKDFGALGGGSFYYTGGGGQTLYGFTTTQVINGYTRIYVPIPAGTGGTIYCRANDNSGGTFYMTAPQIEYGDYPTAYISNDTTASVITVGPVANVPRLDYLNSSCPRLLLEPQRTNLWLESENSSGYLYYDVTTSTNTSTSPSGTQSADTVTSNTTSNFHIFGCEVISFSSGTSYSSSIFVKANTGRYIQLLGGGGAFDPNSYANFDLQTGTVTFQGSSASAKIESYGNGWYRCQMTATTYDTTNDRIYLAIITTANAARAQSHTTALSYYVWGGQCEVGAYATSYIPTLGAAVTRGADACSKTGISSLIGQTEGVLFVDFVLNGQQNNANILNSEKNTTQAFFMAVQTDGDFDAGLYVGGSLVGRIQWPAGITIGQRCKVAYAYKSGSFALYINGVQSGTLSSTFTPLTTFDDIFLNDPTTYFNYQENVSFNQALLFKTRLTNAQLAELTTI